MGKSVEYNGVKYTSVAKLAETIGMNENTLRSRLNDGWTVEKAVETPLILYSGGRRRAVIYRGKGYKSIAELCEELHIDRMLVIGRISDGWTLEEAVETPKVGRQKIVIEGVEYRSKEAVYNAYGVSRWCVEQYVKNGMSFEEAVIAVRESYDSRNVYEYDSKRFTTYKEIDDYIGVSRGTVCRYMRYCSTLEEACEKARKSLDKVDICLNEYPGSTRIKIYPLRLICGDDITLLKEWLERIYLDYPTEFHGNMYKSVADACDALGLPLDIIRKRMMKLLPFQEAVHDKYYVWGNKIYKTKAELGKAMSVTMEVRYKISKDVSSNDELVERLQEYAGGAPFYSESLSLSHSNKNISSVVSCRNGYYMVYCATCGRPLYLTKDEANTFEHSEEFCSSHVQSVLHAVSVKADSFRLMMNKRKDYESVIDVYTHPDCSITIPRIKARSDVAKVRAQLGGNYFVVTCAVCGKNVMLPYKEALVFKHSDDCIKNEWLE